MKKAEQNRGEIKVTLDKPIPGIIKLTQIGWKEAPVFEEGRIRFVIDMDQIKNPTFYSMPTFEFVYSNKVDESHWQVDFNEEMILDKLDHQGHKTLFFLKKDILEKNWQHHENRLVFHAEFSTPVQIDSKESYFNLFK